MSHLENGDQGHYKDFPCIYLMTSVTQGTMLSNYILEKILEDLIKIINTFLHINILYFTRVTLLSFFHITSGNKSKQNCKYTSLLFQSSIQKNDLGTMYWVGKNVLPLSHSYAFAPKSSHKDSILGID